MDKHQLEQIAKTAAALHGREHSYTQGSDFVPHRWVLAAMQAAIDKNDEHREDAYQCGYEAGHSEGYAEGLEAGDE